MHKIIMVKNFNASKEINTSFIPCHCYTFSQLLYYITYYLIDRIQNILTRCHKNDCSIYLRCQLNKFVSCNQKLTFLHSYSTNSSLKQINTAMCQ